MYDYKMTAALMSELADTDEYRNMEAEKWEETIEMMESETASEMTA